MPKTGGTALTAALKRHVRQRPLYTSGPQHDGWRDMLPHFRAPIVLGTVREPVSWYASLYAHARRTGRRDHLIRTWGGGSLAFRDVLYGWTHPTPERVPRHWVGCLWPGSVLRGDSLYQHAMDFFYGDEVTHLIDTSQLAEGLSVALGREVDVPPLNQSGQDYSDWYDEESLGWVKPDSSCYIRTRSGVVP